MTYWRYTERDGNPTEPGYYVREDNADMTTLEVGYFDGVVWGEYEDHPDEAPDRWAPLPTDRPEGVDVEIRVAVEASGGSMFVGLSADHMPDAEDGLLTTHRAIVRAIIPPVPPVPVVEGEAT